MATAIPHVSSDITHSTEIESDGEEHLHRATSAPQQPKNEPVPLIGNQVNMTEHEMKAMKLHKLMEDDLQFIDEAYENLKNYKAEVARQQERAKENLKFQEISKVEKVVMRLKTEIPSKVKVRYSAPTDRDAKQKEKLPNREKNEHLSGVHSFYKKDLFKNNAIFKEFEANFNLLDRQHKQCLLCFALFPEDATIKKRLLMYWWIGEGFILSDVNAEADAEKVLKELISKNFIQPVYDKCPFKKKAHSYKLQPLAHAAVTMLAERENFIDFDDKGDPMREHTRSLRSCLVPRKDKKLEKEELHGRPDDKNNSNSRTTSSSKSGNSKNSDKPMAHVVFNLNEAFLRLRREWFTEIEHVNILYLGRWDYTSKKHIEVEEPKDLDGLANLKYVRFLSLQGISGITEIPESISKLWNLSVLDLRACHSLEVIPEGIGSLHNLTYLDLSECYLLSRMPKGLRALTNLVALKGFEVQDSTDKHSCTLEDLLAMTNLSKLSIHTEIEDFPRQNDLYVLKKFGKLRILTIEWGGNLFRNPDSSVSVPKPGMFGIARTMSRIITRKKVDENVLPPTGFPPILEKLDLKCFPRRSAPTWLKPDNLQKLNKLYIRGGELRDLGQFEFGTDPEPWNNVKTLRLKYLTEMEMDWTEFRDLFPKVEYLEKVKCPKLTMFPCNAHGVWKDKRIAF